MHKKGQIQPEEAGTLEIPTLRKTTVKKEVEEEEQEIVKLKKIQSAPTKEAEEDKPQKVDRTTVIDVEKMVHKEEVVEVSVVTRQTEEDKKSQDKDNGVKKSDIKKPKEQDLTETSKDPWARHKPSPKHEIPEDKIALKKTPKAPKDEEALAPGALLRKVKKLPLDEEEPEVVKLKPHQKPSEIAEELQKDIKDKPDKDTLAFQKGDRVPRQVETKEPTKKPEKTPADVKEPPAKVLKPGDKKKTPEKETEPYGASVKVKKIPMQEPEVESVKLKPMSKPQKEAVEPEKKPPEDKGKKSADGLQHAPTGGHERLKEKEAEQRKPEISEAPEKRSAKEAELLPVDKTMSHVPVSVKKPERVPEEPIPVELKKGVTPKAKEDKEEVTFKPVEQLKKVELKKTPSPKKEKLKEAEAFLIEKKLNADKLRKTPKTVSPNDSVEAVTLKKILKKTSVEEKVTDKVPLVKEISPRAVEMKKVSTQPEEEVFEEEFEAEEEAGQEDEEAWGWELVPRDSYGSDDLEREVQDEALEVPGVTRRGELAATNSLGHSWETPPIMPWIIPLTSPSCLHVNVLHHRLTCYIIYSISSFVHLHSVSSRLVTNIALCYLCDY